MDAVTEIVVTGEIAAKKVAEMVAMGLPTAAIATELVAQATVLMIDCPIEQARASALNFWETVFAGMQKAAAEQKIPSNVLQFGPPVNSA